ncbi:MAG: ADP-ribosylglycohydrolase family protein [Lachnospiraceae bacterium]|nr:ADP-ribosylglycohydrolase family protein [Lachnospiraceae bacterium]
MDNSEYKKQFLNAIKGSFIGGAAGDALGYSVEFKSEEFIFDKYGEDGITEYEIDVKSGKALISDDTQMALFTANGILIGKTRLQERGIGAKISRYVNLSYLDWLKTQSLKYDIVKDMTRGYTKEVVSWLCDVPELFSLRAPGNTCLSGIKLHQRYHDIVQNYEFKYDLSDEKFDKYVELSNEYLKYPINDSKGCGGVMRVAPLAMAYDVYKGEIEILKEVDLQAAEISAITHGHPLGYMPSAVLVHIINRIIFWKNDVPLKDIVIEAKNAVSEIFEGNEYLEEMNRLIDLAINLSENNDSDLNNIHKLGEGWVAEEALAIALYCSLKYSNDFSKAIIAAVNHKGDSDSTGAITGNIVGAIVGYEAIDNKWKTNLELSDVILEMAEDICFQDPNSPGEIIDEKWEAKYWKAKRK